MSLSTIRITKANGSLLAEGLEFVRKNYQISFGTNPVDIPQHLLVAYVNMGEHHPPTIIGTIGISVWEPDCPIRLARIYEFDWNTAPRPIIPETIFEYSRLIATRRGISKALIAAASEYALSIGRICGWCEHTDAVHRICMSFGLRFMCVQATVRKDAVDEGDKKFYERNPSARLYMNDTREWADTLNESIIYENETWSIR